MKNFANSALNSAFKVKESPYPGYSVGTVLPGYPDDFTAIVFKAKIPAFNVTSNPDKPRPLLYLPGFQP